MAERDSNFHFRILEQIAQDLSGEVNFPTCLDAAVLVRDTLGQPDTSLERAAQVISVEPLIASKVLRLANSASYNPAGNPIADLKTAIGRLGFDAVRTAALAVALDQMQKARHVAAFETLSKGIWEHSVRVAAIACVLARRLGRVKPDEALLAGMVHDIGIFYLLYRGADIPEYRDNRDAILDLVVGWHESIGESLLHALGLPEAIIDAVRNHSRLRSTDVPCNLGDVLYFANLLAGDHVEGLDTNPADAEASVQARARYADLMVEAESDIRELQQALVA